ncbi:YwdI family protein [Halobacillus sp. A5]|uniref:YwdI family protein n=1 Tax=Halobacillus sp. A5 TaxID=2880263 RepID=UPI0020A635FB|nr:YwdI family protein [Halobacillus sp. A5]MCP3027517.1 YwdI family protein [Halobacillus sp. A5]
MAISNQTILKKMSGEIQEAMLNHGDEHRVREHVRAVKLLADLVLDEGSESSVSSYTKSESSSVQEPTVEEIRKMMGSEKPVQKPASQTEGHDDANGKSIFDF